MSYETVAHISQVASLLIFIAMFLAACAYALWPSNGAVFDATQRDSLDLDRSVEEARRPVNRGLK
ncbi:MAG: cbb3-type cytochrome c oxidase subunit 3 [Proteobacteria bacterium]|nr:cbb3-type cytochrome c oxidase subunit 3 [Pseudomonadota bacterium]